MSSRGERQKDVADSYRKNWDNIWRATKLPPATVRVPIPDGNKFYPARDGHPCYGEFLEKHFKQCNPFKDNKIIDSRPWYLGKT